jgi:hypothetical protein
MLPGEKHWQIAASGTILFLFVEPTSPLSSAV